MPHGGTPDEEGRFALGGAVGRMAPAAVVCSAGPAVVGGGAVGGGVLDAIAPVDEPGPELAVEPGLVRVGAAVEVAPGARPLVVPAFAVGPAAGAVDRTGGGVVRGADTGGAGVGSIPPQIEAYDAKGGSVAPLEPALVLLNAQPSTPPGRGLELKAPLPLYCQRPPLIWKYAQ